MEMSRLPCLSKAMTKRLRSLAMRKYREREGLFLVEGTRVCQEAIESGWPLQMAVLSQEFLHCSDSLWIEQLLDRGIEIFQTTEHHFAHISNTVQPQGVLLVAKMPPRNSAFSIADNLILALDGIKDPGNMGSILRTSDWFGIKQILVSKNSVDCTSPKVVRSSMGGLFRIKVYPERDLINDVELFRSQRVPIIASHPRQGKILRQFKAKYPLLLIIGSEAQGIDSELEPFVTDWLTIKGRGHVESLNAAIAFSIIIYELTNE
jgi:RNA methyltransferase, TrmH family